MANLTVYYDGLCRLCSREIEHYKKHPKAHLIQWTDITAANFDAASEGLILKDVHRSMHARKDTGQLLKGIDSFLAIWEVLGDYKWLVQLVNSKVARPIFELSYATFAKLRPYLPKRKRDQCDDNHCAT
jgi:predicted DCC family thiol-disulfide oxidoreductase YuxK